MAEARKITSGYRLSLVLGAVSCLITLLINLGATIYAGTKPDVDHDGRGRRVLYEGSCDKSKNLNTGLHVLINILSSILLGASNYGIQCLSAPTREQVDQAHAKGTYLDVGIISVRNLGHQTGLTRLLWFSLVLSSIPLHLLYNSVIFSSLTVLAEYPVILIDQRGESTPERLLALMKDDIDTGWISIPQSAIDLMEDYIDGGVFNELPARECIDQYAVSFLTTRGGVFLVHQLPEDFRLPAEGAEFLLEWESAEFDRPGSSGFDETFDWICRDLDTSNDERCRPLIDDIRNDNASNSHWQPYIDAPVKHCLSKPIENQLCRVNFNIPLAVGVIIANLVKMFILGYTAIYLAPDRLLVLGDAIQSFLARPDPYSRQSCLASVGLVRGSSRSRGAHWSGARSLYPTEKRWVTPVGKIRVGAGVFLYATAFLIVLVLFVWGITAMEIPTNFKNIWSLGFGQPSEQTIISWPGSRGNEPNIAANVVLANVPHLLFSFIYFQWNAIFTGMLMGKEWNDFSMGRVALRVSDVPRHKQRSRYFLQLPFRFSVPLISASILLHWVLSQSIFIVAIELRGGIGPRNVDDSISWGLVTCGYSPMAILTNLLVSLIIPISVYVVGWRRLPGLMPAAGSCSLAIAAACHHPDGDGHPDAALGTLRWGVMRDWKMNELHHQEDQEHGEQERRGLLQSTTGYDHCGISDTMVEEPQKGVVYA